MFIWGSIWLNYMQRVLDVTLMSDYICLRHVRDYNFKQVIISLHYDKLLKLFSVWISSMSNMSYIGCKNEHWTLYNKSTTHNANVSRFWVKVWCLTYMIVQVPMWWSPDPLTTQHSHHYFTVKALPLLMITNTSH